MGYFGRRRKSGGGGYGYPEYVPVGVRKLQAAEHMNSLKKKGQSVNPVVIEGRKIAKTFWGMAWCDNLEAYSDYENRLPRGRTYVRNGSVIDLQITKGLVKAQVMGSSLYHIAIELKPTPETKWRSLVKACAGKIDSLIELLQGKFSKSVMEVITEKEGGLFPKPQEISMRCSCPDSAGMCKHIAAVMYGIGAILDAKPEWLFTLRHVDHMDLISSAGAGNALMQNQVGENAMDDGELSSLFGIEMDDGKASKAIKPSQTQKASKAMPKTKAKAAIKAAVTAPATKKTTAKAKSPTKVAKASASKAKPEKASSAKKAGSAKSNPKEAKEKVKVKAKKS